MDRSEIKASILRTVNEEIDSWLAAEPTITDAFTYEQRLFEHSLRIGRSMLINSQGQLPKDRNAKKKF